MLTVVVILAVAGIALVLIGRNLESRARQAATWPTVEGVLESCEVVEVEGARPQDQSSWQLRIRYSYFVRGTTYHSTRYAFGYGDGRDDEKHIRVADELGSQNPLLVHYDPVHPAEAVISIEPQTNISRLGYSTLAVGVVAGLIWLATQ